MLSRGTNSHCGFRENNIRQCCISCFEVFSFTNSDTLFDPISICLSTSKKNHWAAGPKPICFTGPKPILLFIRWSWSRLTALSNKWSWMTGSILFYVDFPELHNQERYHVSWGMKHLCYQVVQVNSHLLNPVTHLPSPRLNPINCAPLLKMGKIEKEFSHLRSHWIRSKIMCTL